MVKLWNYRWVAWIKSSFSLWVLYYMKKKAVTIEASQLIEFLDQELKKLPDNRKGDNKKYTVQDAGRAAFSVFFTQSPSFLQHQRLMKQKKGQDNAKSLFGLAEIPCDNHALKFIRSNSSKNSICYI